MISSLCIYQYRYENHVALEAGVSRYVYSASLEVAVSKLFHSSSSYWASFSSPVLSVGSHNDFWKS